MNEMEHSQAFFLRWSLAVCQLGLESKFKARHILVVVVE